MTTDERPGECPSDEAVARAMRGLGSDIYDVMNMALITSNSLEEILELQADDAQDCTACHLVLPRALVDSQKWAATHVVELSKRLMARFEAAFNGVEMA